MAYNGGRRLRVTSTGALAWASLACAVLGFLVVPLAIVRVIPPLAGVPIVPAEILAIVVGRIARLRGESTGDGGEGLARAGRMIGYGFFALVILAVLAVLLVPGLLFPGDRSH